MLSSGARVGPYTILGQLGSGGMGEVYRARDPRLDRDVAIKVLPAAFAADASRIARFEQEARTIAALSHPNVLAVFDTGLTDASTESARYLYIVTELLEGETLRGRLAAGPLPVRKTIEFGVQIARGLAAAHEKGAVHRDLKPDNIFLTASGQVKILDFALARSMTADAAPNTVTRPAVTDAGTVLGTAGYMAPEQVRGQGVDARADLFAFGAVLYELLSGQRAFRGSSPADTMSAILREDPPDLAATRPDIPPALDRIVRHCLEKNPDERFQTARDVAFAVESLSTSGVTSRGTTVESPAASRLLVERLAWVLVTALLGGLIIWMPFRSPAPSAAFGAPHRTMLVLPDGVALSHDVSPPNRFSVSPDGTHVAFVGTTGRGSMLWLQALDETSARSIEGSEGADAPFWSPDSRVVGFRRSDQLMTLDVFGSGRLETLTSTDGAAAWMTGPSGDDLILTTVGASPTRGIRTWSRRSRTAIDLFSAPADMPEVYALPASLFDGRHFLFAHGLIDDPATPAIYLGTHGSSEKKRLLSFDPLVESINAAYASGYLLMARNQSITARTFDRKTMMVASEAADVAGPVQTSPRAGAAFSVSQNGVLVYESSSNSERFRLTVYDRTGQLLRTLSDDAAYTNLELSPDGSQLALAVTDPATRSRDIWVIDVVRGVRSRVTFDPSDERSAVWSLDGKSLVYTSKGLDLYGKAVGTGTETVFLKDGLSKDPRGWSPDGESFVYRVSGQTTRNDLWIKPRDPAKAPYPFLATPFDENYAVFAPDSRWMAYVSDESGRPEVYATSFPSGQGKVRISTDGGTFPRWRRDGKEIVYLAPDGKLVAVAVAAAGGTLMVQTAQALFETRPAPGPGEAFDMSADGQRFVVNTMLPSAPPPSLIVLYNWPALIEPTPRP